MTVVPFDPDRWRRHELGRLRREREHLDEHRRRLERLPGLACTVAAAGRCSALTLLAVLEEIVDRAERPPLAITDPARHEEWLDLLRS